MNSTHSNRNIVNSNSRRTRLGFEQLEGRRLMAASILNDTACDLTQSAVVSQASNLRSGAASINSVPRLAAATVDDAFEDNDGWLQAADLGSVSQAKSIDNLVMADSADWFRFTLPTAPTAGSTVRISFLNAQGDLDLSLYSSNGRKISGSNGTGNSEQISLSGQTGTTFYVLVYGYRGAKNANYTLTITPPQTTTPTPVTDDAFEPNNSMATAANLGSLTAARTTSNLVMADSNDWFQFQVSGTGTTSRYVGINFTNSQGDLDLEVLDASGRRVGLSDGVANSERVSLNGLGTGTYFVRVYGYRGVANPNYQLIVDPGVPAVPVTPTPTPTPTASGFNIEMNATGLTATQQAVFNSAIARWQQIIVGDLPNVTYRGRVIDDLAIDVSASNIDGAGGVLGQATADRFRSGSQLPYHGVVQFDSADLAQMEADGTLFSVVLHEIGHVLGIGTLWESLGLLSGAGTSNPIFTGAQATAEYNALTGGNARGVPVESSGGSGTADSHWRDSIFANEIMTGYIGPGRTLPLSRVTVASLADLGYQVNISAADAYRLS